MSESVETANRNGWEVGTRLIGFDFDMRDEQHEAVLEIVFVGRRRVLVVALAEHEPDEPGWASARHHDEMEWDLSCGQWRRLTSDDESLLAAQGVTLPSWRWMP